MRPQKLYATTGEFTLLKNNKAKHIGFATDGLHYNECGVIVPQIIVFHFGTTHQDFFAFENNQMVFPNLKTKNYVNKNNTYYFHYFNGTSITYVNYECRHEINWSRTSGNRFN